MGNSNSVDWKLPDQSVAMFHEAMNWIERNQHENGIMYDDETIKDYLENKIKEFIIEPSNHSTEDKESLITNQVIKSPRPPTASIIINSILSPVAAFAVSGQMTIEDSYQSTSKNTAFMDSSYHQNWLSKQDADKIFNHLYEEGKHMHAQMKSMQVKNPNIKYPLSTLTYGAKRILDGALALDRWGSYHESWCRVMEPTDEISKLCDTMRTYFHLPSYALNSVVVNYYWDGSSTHIPAHQDTVACLDDNR